MKYAVFAQDPSFTGIIVMAVILVIMLAFAAVDPTPFSAVVAVIVLAIIALMFFNHNTQISEAAVKNQEAATKNLRIKYELKEVYWDARETTANPKDTESNENLVIESLDGEKHIFKYEVDLKTREPFLSDMPKAGGNPDKPSITADSLLQEIPNK